MPGGRETQTTQAQFDPLAQGAREQLGGIIGQGLQPGGLQDIFGQLQPQINVSPLQRQAVNQLGQFLNQPAPEVRALETSFGPLQDILTGQQDLVGAVSPVFQQNLGDALTSLQAQAPGRFGSAFLQGGTNIAQRSLADFNLLTSQLAQQQQQNQLGAARTLGLLAGSAGAAPFGRLAGAGQLGLQESQFLSQPAFIGQQNQQQLQLALLQLLGGLGAPTGQQQVQTGGGGIGNLLGGILGFGAGSFLGPFGGAIGQRVGRSIFGGNDNA